MKNIFSENCREIPSEFSEYFSFCHLINYLGKCHFLPGGGLLKIGGDQVPFLRSKGGIKRFFQINKGGSLIFFKEIKYFVKHS